MARRRFLARLAAWPLAAFLPGAAFASALAEADLLPLGPNAG